MTLRIFLTFRVSSVKDFDLPLMAFGRSLTKLELVIKPALPILRGQTHHCIIDH